MMRANMHVTDYDAVGNPGLGDLARHAVTMPALLVQELAGAASATGIGGEEILLGALGRAIQRTIGEGFATVDVARVGSAVHPVALACVDADRMPAADMLAAVAASLAAVSALGVSSSMPQEADHPSASDVLFTYGSPLPSPAVLGHFLEVHARLAGTELVLEYWYDTRSFESYTIVELAEQFPYAMIELTSEATRPILAAPELAAAY